MFSVQQLQIDVGERLGMSCCQHSVAFETCDHHGMYAGPLTGPISCQEQIRSSHITNLISRLHATCLILLALKGACIQPS